jgi:hypothetical protein
MFSLLHCEILWHYSTLFDISCAMLHYATASSRLVEHAHKTGLVHRPGVLLGGGTVGERGWNMNCEEDLFLRH